MKDAAVVSGEGREAEPAGCDREDGAVEDDGDDEADAGAGAGGLGET